ncbi:MAG: TonB-dependent receptor [Bacteroidales bacterium]
MHSFIVKRTLFLCGAAMVCSATLSGQQKDTILKEVVVSGVVQRSVSKASAPVQVMNKEGIAKLGIQELYEAVKTFSGVSIKDYGGIGGVKTVSVRSLGAQHTAVCYDGVTMSDAQGGQIDIGRFSLDQVDQVTLTIGQGDDIFQSARMFASAGVLNIKTSAPRFTDKKTNIGIQLKGGSFGMFNPSVQFDGQMGKNWAVSLTGDWMRAEGEYPYKLTNGTLVTNEKRQNTDVDIWRTELNLYGKVGHSGRVLVKGNYLASERGLPGSVVLYNTNSNKERLWDKNGFVQAGYENAMNKKWEIQTYLKYSYAWNRYLDMNDKYQDGKQDDRYTQNEYYGSARVKFTPSHLFTFTFAQDIFENTLQATIPDCPNPNRLTSMSALAGQYMSERFTATASLLAVFNTENVERGEAAPTRKHLSPSVGVSWKIVKDKNIRLRLSVKDAYRIPTFNDLYYARIGNTSLKPERATQYNAGITFNDKLFPNILDFVTVSADGYYNRVRDKIVAIPTMFIWKMMNMGTVDIWGTDFNFSTGITVCKNVAIQISGNYSYQYAVDLTDETAKNYKHQIPYTPQHSGNVSVSCTNKWVNLGYTMSVVGERYALPQNIADNRIDGYCEQNVSLSRSFYLGKCRLSLQAEMLNLGDAMYDVIQYYPMPGRQYRFTLKFRY